jgi:predicted N-acetyltransferase YhbS
MEGFLMNIRQENRNDYDTIYQLVRTAFETAKVKDGHEQDFVNSLRDSSKYIPELALVAEEDGSIIGHIMLSRTCVENETGKFEALHLAPVSVVLEHRNQGVGSKLIQTAMKLATDMGFQAVFLAGDPAYYRRFGFVPTIRYGIKYSAEIPEELVDHIMVCELAPNALDGVYGKVELK